jgi:hypothetical protein
MHTDGRIDRGWTIRNATSALGTPCWHQKGGPFIAEAVCRPGLITDLRLERLALLGLLAGLTKLFGFFHCIAAPARPFFAPVADLCAFYSNPYPRPIGFVSNGRSISEQNVGMEASARTISAAGVGPRIGCRGFDRVQSAQLAGALMPKGRGVFWLDGPGLGGATYRSRDNSSCNCRHSRIETPKGGRLP